MKKDNLLIITPVNHIEKFISEAKKFFRLKILKNPTQNVLKKNIKNTKYIFTNPNMTQIYLGEKLLKNTDVKAICTASTGTIHIDEKYCKKQNIKVLSLKNDKHLLNQLTSTSDLAFGFLINAVRKIPQSTLSVSKGKWSYLDFKGRMIKNLQIGIIGYGRLGSMMDKYCTSFGAKTYIYDPYLNIPQIPQTSLEIMFKECDVISLHVHVTDKTKYMINKNLLGLAKKDLYIINTSRGEIVNEQDIVNAFNKGKLKGYGTDVIENEFDDLTKSPIIKAMNEGKNIIVTPHIGGMTIEGQTKAYKWSIDKL